MEASLDDPRHQRLLEWLLTAPAGREPKTLEGFATSQGVSPRTTRDWREKPAFKVAWDAGFKEIAGSRERTKVLIDGLFDDSTSQENSASERTAAAKLYHQITKDIAPPEPVVADSRRAQDLTDQDLRRLVAQAARDELSERGAV